MLLSEEKENVSYWTLTVEKSLCSVVFKANFYLPMNANPSYTNDVHCHTNLRTLLVLCSIAEIFNHLLIQFLKKSFCGIIFNDDQNRVTEYFPFINSLCIYQMCILVQHITGG